MPRSVLTRLIAAIAAIAVAMPIAAATGEVIKLRIAAYKKTGAAFKNINDQARSATPDIRVIKDSAHQIRSVAQRQYRFFPEGTDSGAGKTKALPDIWRNASEFKEAQDSFKVQAEAFVSIARSGDLERIRPAVRDLGRACASCHRQFRAK